MTSDEKSYLDSVDHLKSVFLDSDHRALATVLMKEFERYAAIEILASEANVDIDEERIQELFAQRWDEVREKVVELTNYIIGEIVSRSEA